MAEPRGIEERIRWFLDHNANGPGMCAQHSWHSLGGDNGSVPAWGCSDANEVYDKVKASGRYWTGNPKRGALVLWKYGNNGHASIKHDSADRIDTTNPDPDNSAGTATDVEDISYPSKWGASSSARIWTDQYNGIRFPVGDEEDDDVKHYFLYLHTSDAIGNVPAGSTIKWDEESADDGGFHSDDHHGFGNASKFATVGTYMYEGSGDAVVEFVKYDAEGGVVGHIGRSAPGGDLTIVQDLPKGYALRVKVLEGSCPDARLKADIRER